MKKVISLLLGLLILSSSAFAIDAKSAVASRKALASSAAVLNDVCQRVRTGLKYEYYFLNYFNYECASYDNKRIRTRDALFPMVNNLEEGYTEDYPKLSTDFVLEMDKKQVDHYKLLVETFCKYNSYRMKDKTPCSAESIKSYFNVQF